MSRFYFDVGKNILQYQAGSKTGLSVGGSARQVTAKRVAITLSLQALDLRQPALAFRTLVCSRVLSATVLRGLSFMQLLLILQGSKHAANMDDLCYSTADIPRCNGSSAP